MDEINIWKGKLGMDAMKEGKRNKGKNTQNKRVDEI